MLIPVGIAMIIVADVKYARVSQLPFAQNTSTIKFVSNRSLSNPAIYYQRMIQNARMRTISSRESSRISDCEI